MYLVWKQRKAQTSRPSDGCLHQGQPGRVSFVPMLVRSHRVNGKPRQEHVAALPSIRSCCLGDAMVRARWWREVEETLIRLQESGKVADEVAKHGQDWRRRVRAALESKVAYPTSEEWNTFDAKITEELRQKQLAEEALAVAEKARREEQQQQQLGRRAEQEARLPVISTVRALLKRGRESMEMGERAMESLRQLRESFPKQSSESQEKEERQQEATQDKAAGESVPPVQEKERRPATRKPEDRRPRRVRI